MNEYLFKIMGLIIFSVVLISILPKGKTSILIKNVVRLCVYFSIVAPIAVLFIQLTEEETKDFSEIFPNYFSENVIETDESYIKYCSEKVIESGEVALSKKILDEFNVKVEVEIILAENTFENEMKIEKICLAFLDNIEDLIAEKIKNRLETEYSVPIEFSKEVKT